MWYYLNLSWKDKGVHTFPKGICPKVNVIARLEYELAYYDPAVHRFNHYATRTPPILETPLLNTQHYKVCIEQFKKRSSTQLFTSLL